LRNTLQAVASEISQGLLLEMAGDRIKESPRPSGIADLLLERLVDEVVRQLRQHQNEDPPGNKLDAGLQRAERKLRKLRQSDADEDEDVADAVGSNFPNLKYAKSKYKNVESILKYAEADEAQGGFKLVIMNFND